MPNSLLFSVIKNSNAWIDEWIRYHLSIGFTHICIIDNNDGLEDYPMPDYTIQQCTLGNVNIENKRNLHLNAIQEFEKINLKYNYSLFLDTNEFLSFKHQEYNNINDFLENKDTSLIVEVIPLDILGETETIDFSSYKRYWPKIFKNMNSQEYAKTNGIYIKKILDIKNDTIEGIY